MGTRNLTIVYIDGSYKVAQYGQWDGYPDGQGLNVLKFLRERMDEKIFKQSLRNTTYIDKKELMDLWKSYGAKENGMVSFEDARKMGEDYPEYSRDTASDILEILQNHPDGMRLQDELYFAADGLFCEWAWVIDFDKRTFEAYKGFNVSELSPDDRFYFLREYERGDYHGIKIVASWSLDNLPTENEFLSAFEGEVE